MAKKTTSRGYGAYTGKKPYGTTYIVTGSDGKNISYASTTKTEAEGIATASALLAKKKTFTEAKSLAKSNDGANRNPFGSSATDFQGEDISGDSLVRFNASWLGHDGNYLQLFPSSSNVSSDDYDKFVLVNEEHGWNFTFDSSKFPDLGKMKNINAPTIFEVDASADGYCQNRAASSGRGSVLWSSSDMTTDTVSSHYYTTQTNIRVTSTNQFNYWYCGRPVLYFNTTSIPAGKTIKKVTVRLYLESHTTNDSDGDTLYIYEWDEFAPGGRITTTDFDGFDIQGGTVDMANVSNGNYIYFDITGDLLADFQSNYGSGYGFMIRTKLDVFSNRSTPTNINQFQFSSIEHKTASQRPQIKVSYI